MIRPAALYNKGRYSRDFSSLGRILAVACGNPRISRDDLTDVELSHLEELENESDEMDKQTEEKKARWAERQRNKRARDKEVSPDVTDVTQCHGDILMSRNVTVTKECHGDSHDVTILPTNLPTYQPNNLPTNNNVCVCATHTTHTQDLNEQKVIDIAKRSMGISEEYARWWFREMESRGWTTTEGKKVDARNWRSVLKSWHNHSKPQEQENIRTAIKAGKKLVIHPEDWILCEERCANFLEGKCKAGCMLPPTRWERPSPPEQCPKFKTV